MAIGSGTLLILFGLIFCLFIICCTEGAGTYVFYWAELTWHNCGSNGCCKYIYRSVRHFPSNHPYSKDWKYWDMATYTINSIFFVIGTVTLSFGTINSVGAFGKLMNSFVALSNQCLAAALLALAALSFDGTRFYMPGWVLTYLVLLIALFLVTATALVMYYDQFAIMDQLREGWVLLDSDTKRDLQKEFNCCGWDFYQDNARLPCTSRPERGCDVVLSHEVDIRVSLMLWMTYTMLICEMVGILVMIPYVGQLHRHIRAAQKCRWEAAERAIQQQADGLLDDSEALRSGALVL